MAISLDGTTGIQTPSAQLVGSSSGNVTLQGAANAGTWSFTMPTTPGTSGYVLGTDGLGGTTWVAQTGGGGGGGTYTRTTFTATAGQTTFTASYTVGYVQVYLNGILLNSADYTATSGTVIVLASAAAAGDLVDVIALNIGTFTSGGYTRTTYTGTAGQTSFTAAYTPGYVQVYLNGVLLDPTDYTASSGTAIVLGTGTAAGDTVDIVALNIGGFTGGVTVTGTPTSGQLTSWTGSTSIQGVASSSVDANLNLTIGGNLSMASSFLRNRLINGNMYTAQRATSATVTAGTTVPTASTGYPCVDRWFVYSTGANVTAAQVAGTSGNRNLLQITGAASVTAVGIGQRIEALNSYDLSGQTCTLSVSIANSVLTTVTWTASYATTTADTFGTIGTPTKTQIATGTFTVNSTLTRYTTNISVPSAATTGIEILFTVGAQTSGTWQIGNVQFEAGSIATPFERQPYTQQVQNCQRYYSKSYDIAVSPGTTSVGGYASNPGLSGGTGNTRANVRFAVEMRATPTMSYWDLVGNASKTSSFNSAGTQTNNITSASFSFQGIGASGFEYNDAGGAGSAGTGAWASAAHWTAAAEVP